MNTMHSDAASQERPSLQSRIFAMLFWLVLCLPIGLLLFNAARAEVVQFDLSRSDTQGQWQVIPSSQVRIQLAWLDIDTTGYKILISPALSELTWAQSPYLTIKFDAPSDDQSIIVLWNKDNNLQRLARGHTALLPFTRDDRQVTLVSRDVRGTDPLSFVWQGNIGQYALLVPESLTITRISHRSHLAAVHSLTHMSKDLIRPEVIDAYAINFLRGPTIAGRAPFLWIGLYLVLLAGMAMCNRRRSTHMTLAAVMLCAFVFSDVHNWSTLIGQLRSSMPRHAWQSAREAELRSRFGDEFAALSQHMQDHLPAHAKVYYSFDRRGIVRGESNWMHFQHHPQYEAVALDDAEFVVYFYPRQLEYNADDRVIVGRNRPPVPVEVLLDVSPEAKLLRKIDG